MSLRVQTAPQDRDAGNEKASSNLQKEQHGLEGSSGSGSLLESPSKVHQPLWKLERLFVAELPKP